MNAIIRSAEESFQNGMLELRYGRPTRALQQFRAAISVASETTSHAKHRAKYFSYYGICLHRTGGSIREVLRVCRKAVTIDPNQPVLWRNLAYVANAAGCPGQAYTALSRAHSLNPGHQGVLGELLDLGVRRRPVLFFLSRTNPINARLGKIRAWMTRSK